MSVPKLKSINTFSQFTECADYSLMATLARDPDAKDNAEDYAPRQVFSGHYVPVKPTPLASAEYIAHSRDFFQQLGLSDELAKDENFQRFFSGDISVANPPMKNYGWATGYALSIYGTEYIQQCPFRTGNGYGDGRAISVFEGIIQGQRWEMQLKGGGRTPYCRGGDGRAVLRSSVREFLAQEHMHALGVPTSRSLSLFVSRSETVNRPWYVEDSRSTDPDTMVANPVAITTRVAPSFLRVGQLELFGRRARQNAHPNALKELSQIVLHVIDREYADEIDATLSLENKVIQLAQKFQQRLTSLICHWLRVGYCQGNFNSDNCACGGYTLDYGPFGFCELFEPFYQPWTGGGQHFSFFNQPNAAKANFESFCSALKPLLANQDEALERLQQVSEGFDELMQTKVNSMWATKLGLEGFDEDLFTQLMKLMVKTPVDFTLFFRELSSIPEHVSQISPSFYQPVSDELTAAWQQWLNIWREHINDFEQSAIKMKKVNPKYTWREWTVVPAYKQAEMGNYELIQALQQVLTQPYAEQGDKIDQQYYQRKPQSAFALGGVSHYSCSS